MKIIEGILEGYKKGLLTPSEIPVEKEEVVYLKEYNERLIKKLEVKILDLKKEITERKRTEEALRESEKKYRELVNTSVDGVISVDSQMKIVLWNQGAERIFGYTEEEMLGQSLMKIVPERYRKAKEKGFAEFRKSGSGPVIGKTLELEGVRKDLTEISVELSVSSRRLGETYIATAIARDITERKRAEEALRESKQRLELALRGADLGLWDWNVQTGELIFDQRWANMLGYSLEEIEPHIRTWEKLVHPDDMPGVMEVLNAHLAGKTPFYETEYRLLTKSGEWKWILGRGRLVEWDKDGKPLRAAGTHLDITERKKVERMQRLVQLGRLVANIAHEVNNPLMIISGRAQLSLMEEVENEEIKKNLQIIFEQTQRAKDIIQRFLRFSKPAKGELKQVDINRSIEEITGIIEHQFKLGGVKIKRNYAQNLPFVSIDEKQIQEVFMNILTNAYDAISGEGIIEITISCEKDFLRIDFKDTGKGMNKEIIDKIFDPFFTTKEKGTGLGLSVCYGIIKAHNGELKFQSLPGQGTTATILLPIKETKHTVYDFSSG
jgi:PAS domain S-box-containing protein